MKTLYLLRHAKAVLYTSTHSDIDRPINEEGKKEAEFIGDLLVKKNELPQLILSSTAIRAIATAKIVAQKINYPENKIVMDKNIYEAGSKKLQSIINNTNTKIESLMLVGHNPGISDLINDISVSNFDFLRTGGLVCLKKDIQSWEEIDSDWKLKFNEYSKY